MVSYNSIVKYSLSHRMYLRPARYVLMLTRES